MRKRIEEIIEVQFSIKRKGPEEKKENPVRHVKKTLEKENCGRNIP